MSRKILAIVHLYPPQHLCGGEMYLHALLKRLQARGNEIRVLLMNSAKYGVDRIYSYDGIEVFPCEKGVIMNCLEWSQTMITHLDYTNEAINYASIMRVPLVHLVHNTYRRPDILGARHQQYVIYNSAWCQEKVAYPYPGIVLHPPVNYRKWDDGADHFNRQYITLVNLDGNKGGAILQRIATAMPDRSFLGIKGSYSEPAKEGQYTDQPPNVRVIDKTQDMRGVYAQTRITIMPSKYESWGMVATESMATGIPVISTGTPGLRENCGTAGIYIQDREDIGAWVEAIKKLDDPKHYKNKAVASRKRAKDLDPEAELETAAQWIEAVRFYSQSTRGAVSTAALL